MSLNSRMRNTASTPPPTAPAIESLYLGMDLLIALYGDRYMFCVKSIERYYFYTWFYCWHHSPWLNTIDIGSWRVHYNSSCVSPPASFFLLGCVCNVPPSYCLFCFCFTRIQVKMLFLPCPSCQHKFQHLSVFYTILYNILVPVRLSAE